MKMVLLCIVVTLTVIVSAALLYTASTFKTNVSGVVTVAASVKMGHSPDCSFEQGIEAWESSRRMGARRVWPGDELDSACRLAQTDQDGVQLWETPYGKFSAGWEYTMKLAVSRLRSGLFSNVTNKPGDVVIIDASIGGECEGYILARRALSVGATKVFFLDHNEDKTRSLSELPKEKQGTDWHNWLLREQRSYKSVRRNFQTEIQDGRVVVSPTSYVSDEKASGGGHLVRNVTVDWLVKTHEIQQIDLIYLMSADRDAPSELQRVMERWKPRVAVYLGDNPYYMAMVNGMVKRGYAPRYGPCVMREAHPSESRLDDNRMVGWTVMTGDGVAKIEKDERRILPLAVYMEPLPAM